MWVYVGFFILSFSGAVFSLHRPPPCELEEPSCPKNQHYTSNDQRCIKTCANRLVADIGGPCKPFTGCICDFGLVRLNDDGTGPCVPASRCPPFVPKGCPGDKVFSTQGEAHSSASASAAYSFSDPETKSSGYSSSESSSSSSSSSSYTSITSGCGGNKCNDPNAVFKKCPNPCPLTCVEPNPRPCPRMCLKDGCECAPGFILSEIGGKCIRPKDCPGKRCPKNAHYVTNDEACQKTCGNRLLPTTDTAGACVPYTGCVCDNGYVRKYDNATGPCIPERHCPPIPKQCGINEEPTSCRIICPPQSCDSIFSSYYCLPYECEPGCDCLNNYLRDSDGVCIPSEDCFKEPECGPNEVLSDCEIVCPPQSCESLYTTYLCAEGNCTVGCNCIDGYLRNSLGMCIPSEECYTDPTGCNGDANATHVECGSACRPTCENPDDQACILMCVLNGCECDPGYILSEPDGVCIEPEDCPGGSPRCGANKTYVDCNVGCPSNYCPVDDSRAMVACSAPYPCPGGCACKAGYLMVSYDDPRCILASECPPVECYRQNEVWDPKPSNCFLERCEDRGSVCDFPYPAAPRCVCEDGYYRNASDVCIPASECPQLGCKGDLNATLKRCPSPCPNTCAEPDNSNKPCIEICLPDDCECNPGYVLTEKGGKCIKLEDCPAETGCGGDPNAVYSDCPSACQPTCADQDTKKPCIAMCLEPGCVCKPGYILTKKGGRCIKPENCPAQLGCKGDRNATLKQCPNPCPNTCAEPDNSNKPCIMICLPDDCECNPGYVLTEKGGKCIKLEDCPAEPGCGGDPNAVYSDCPSACQPTCADQDTNKPCIAMCLEPGCVCKPGYILTKKDGRCIKPEHCPAQLGCKGDRNATLKQCPNPCPNTCAEPDNSNKPCILICLPDDCECNPGYVLTEKGGKCIKPEDCPVLGCNGDPNASFTECRSACPATCANKDLNLLCPAVCLPSGCECNPGYVLTDEGGKCIKPEDCPAEPLCNGDRNATFKECPSACQATCADPDTDGPCIDMCMPDGCVCKQGYLLTKTGGRCIKPEDCPGGSPTCGVNETYVYCKVGCPTNYCPVDDSLYEVACDPIWPCPGGCACKAGYLLTTTDERCILSSECPPVECTRPNEVWNPSPPSCLRERCDNRNTGCDFPYPRPPKCVCKEGFFRNENDICVPESECPKTACNGDFNATFVDCPSPCPATCCEPDSDRPCITVCADPGCECNDGYILTKPGGVCIRPSDCEGGSPSCGPNQTYTTFKIDCPMKYCPVGPHEIFRICDPVYPTPSGCICKNSDYLMLNKYDKTCILAIECPPVECPDPNEVWNTAPPTSHLEKCGDMYYSSSDNQFPVRPRCTCKEGYCRDLNDACIPVEESPCQKPDACKRTCADPNPPNCDWSSPNVNINGCDCKEGYVLSELGGDCIKIEDCPRGCNGDSNARTKQCPLPCPSTCQSPNALPCKRMCDPIGCECEPGYILSNSTGLCILPENCPGGNPCGKNAHFVPCKVNCPRDYCPVDDSRAIVVCDPPHPCLSGCVCNLNHKRKSLEDPRCIVSSDCPPVECTRPNEEWSSCPSACLAERCEDVNNQPSVCHTLVLNCEPACICEKNHFRNGTDICIPAENCPKPGCNGDLNATFVDCPSPCPATCCEPDSDRPCITVCADPGCECNEGYILTKPGGVCISPTDCPGGSPSCGTNKTYTSCKVDCHMKYCPVDEDEIMVICDPVWPCPSGCECKGGYLMLSTNDRTCVLARDCPPVVCTEPNEVWNPSPPDCDFERCEDIYNNCDDASPGRPRCTCKEGYYRDQSDICVPAEECPCQIPDKCKRTCANPNPPNCIWSPPKSNIDGCDCKEGYILSELGGDCIKIEQCPGIPGCNGDLNATFVDCPSPCPATCCEPDSDRPCITGCADPGCECNYGHILTKPGGVCIRPTDCPGGSPSCGTNMTYTGCKIECPSNYCPQSEHEIKIICDPVWPCPTGCVCKSGYLMLNTNDRTCILARDCPPVVCTGPNEVWNPTPPNCDSFERCEDIYNTCDDPNPGRPTCTCKEGYYRDQNDVCVPAEECPKPKCGYNEVKVPCRQICPPQNCEIAYTDYACTEESKICEPGCNCFPDHLRNGSGICIPNEECTYPSTPVCGINEIARDCRRICPPQTCLGKYALYRCVENIPCEPGCDCVPNYLRDERGMCVRSEDCPAPCQIPDECKRTCANPNPPNCDWSLPKSNIDGCDCKEGYILSELGGDCIRIEECPGGCNGDPHAITKQCPQPCPSTCQAPNAIHCYRMCDPIGCECEPGYILSNSTGRCILPEKCPGGNPCGKNEQFVHCKVNCPRDYCPEDDSRAIAMCEPPSRCLSGCICNLNYKRKSRKDPRCIVSSDCPPVICTRQNEKWSSCPSACLAERCEDVNNQPSVCYPLILNCQPACICKKNHFRNGTDICIPAKDCPSFVPKGRPGDKVFSTQAEAHSSASASAAYSFSDPETKSSGYSSSESSSSSSSSSSYTSITSDCGAC